MRTALCDKLGIEVPIVLAPLGRTASPHLAASVSNAGGLGMLAPWALTLDALRQELRETKSLTSLPFAVNLNMAMAQADRLEVCREEGVRVVSFFWDDKFELVARAKAAGMTVLQSIGTAVEARRAVDAGADIVVAQGWEAGGHVRGTVATLPLVPAVVDAVPGVPVVAAGGISDARGLAAVLAAGAAGAWIGTRFLAAEETHIHPAWRAQLLAATEDDTVYAVDLFDIPGWPNAPHRAIRNSTARMWEAAGRPPIGKRPHESDVIGAQANGNKILRYRGSPPRTDVTGDVEAMSLWAGQSVGLVKKVQPAAEIMREINDGAQAILRRLGAA